MSVTNTDNALPTAPAVVREKPGGESMRAIVLEKFGGLDSLVYTDIPKPLPKDGEVVIQVKGFGINHAELHMRRGEWAEAAEVSGIECVGIVDSCPGGEFAVGAKVAALMGGLGRTINGSYAEYTRSARRTSPLSTPNCPGRSWLRCRKPLLPRGHAFSATSNCLRDKPSSSEARHHRSARPPSRWRSRPAQP
jgi:hypothetical protein